MELAVKNYKQKGMTCSIVCLLMVLEYYNLIPKAVSFYEKKYYNLYKSKYTLGVPFSAIAWHFVKKGLKTMLIHSEKDMFSNEKHIFEDAVFKNLIFEYNDFLLRAQKLGLLVSNRVKLDPIFLKKQLEMGRLVVLAGMQDSFFHAILLCGFTADKFIVCDPLKSQKIKMTKEELESFMITPIGSWAIVVYKD